MSEGMTVERLIEKLKECNPKANMVATANNRLFTFSLVYGGPEGSTKKDCSYVSIYVDDTNQGESA